MALPGGFAVLDAQNSLDGQHVYVTNSLFSSWDNQFYPGIKGWLTKLDRQPDGTYALDPDFYVDFHEQADGARPHEHRRVADAPAAAEPVITHTRLVAGRECAQR